MNADQLIAEMLDTQNLENSALTKIQHQPDLVGDSGSTQLNLERAHRALAATRSQKRDWYVGMPLPDTTNPANKEFRSFADRFYAAGTQKTVQPIFSNETGQVFEVKFDGLPIDTWRYRGIL
jgi:hypothetical protein